MDWQRIKSEGQEFFRKYRWAAVVLLAGLALMLMPTRSQPKTVSVPAEQAVQEGSELAGELEELLSRVEGAGKVKVLLSEAVGESVLYQTDEAYSRSDTAEERKLETVIVTASDRSQTGLVRRRDPPLYLGAIVLCQGADSAAVRLAMVDAVGSITGLSSDKISVLKMK